MGGGTVCVRRNDTHVVACLLAFGALWVSRTEGYLLAGRVRGTQPSVEAAGCCGSQVFLVLFALLVESHSLSRVVSATMPAGLLQALHCVPHRETLRRAVSGRSSVCGPLGRMKLRRRRVFLFFWLPSLLFLVFGRGRSRVICPVSRWVICCPCVTHARVLQLRPIWRSRYLTAVRRFRLGEGGGKWRQRLQ